MRKFFVAFALCVGMIAGGAARAENNCTGATYYDADTDTCVACPDGYDYNTDSGKTDITQCQIHCDAGTFCGVPPSSYASDGLLLLLDGYENTQNGNDPNTNVWYDLSPRQNNANLIGGVQYDSVNHGYIFDANSKYAVTQNSLGLSGAAIGTLEFAGVWYGKGSSQVNGLFTLGNGGQNYSITGAVDRFTSVNVNVGMSLVPTAGVPFTITYISSNGAISGFRVMLNGQQVASGSSGAQLSLPGDPLQIGRFWQFSNYNRSFNGIINSVRVYDRVLTQQEIQDNYEIDTIRFKSDFGTGQCTNVGAGYWAAASTVNFGDDGARNACPAGTTTVGYGHGADSANDCGRVLHIGDYVLYARRDRVTSPSLNIRIPEEGIIYYINLGSANHDLSRLHLMLDGVQYTAYDDSLYYGERDFDTGEQIAQ